MARLVTVASLIAHARNLADQVGSTYVTPAQALASFQEHYGDFYDILLQEDADFFPVTYEEFSADGSSSYAAPATLGSIVGIDRLDGQQWAPLDEFSITERHAFPVTGGGPATKYRMNGETVELRPVPGSGTYRWVFHAVPATLTTASTINDVAGWTRYIVLGVAIDMKLKEGTDPSGLMAKQQEFKADLFARISRRKTASPRRIRDVHAERGVSDPADYWTKIGADF